MIRVLTSLVTQHHPATVLLASLVCAIAAGTSSAVMLSRPQAHGPCWARPQPRS